MTKYNVFIRRWWRDNPKWPNGLEPHMGRKTYYARNVDYDTARSIAKEYNATHKPGRYSLKAEFKEA